MITTRRKFFIFIFLALLGLTNIGYSASNPADIPLEIFAKHPYVKSPKLSPDGKYVAALVSVDGVYQVGVADFEKRKLKLVYTVAQNERSQLDWVDWANNSRLIISYSWLRESQYVRTTTGKDLRYKRMVAVNKDGSDAKFLEYQLPKSVTRESLGRKRRIISPVYQDDVIDFLPEDKDHILVQLDGDIEWGVDHVYKLNVYTAKYKRIQKNFQNVYRWVTNRDGELSLAIARDENSKYRKEFYYRKPGSSKWDKIIEYKVFEEAGSAFKGFDATGTKLYFISYKDYDKGALYIFDPESKTMGKPIYRHDKVEIDDIFYDFSKNKVTGVTFIDDLPNIHYFDNSDAQFQKSIDGFLKGLSNMIVSQSRDGNRKVIASVNGRQPQQFLLYDKRKNSLKRWYGSYKKIDLKLMAERRPISFSARDGMKLFGYITLPNKITNKLPPVVVYPHGGPNVRDIGMFESFSQALASRGYAVLQVNFRGSSGFGSHYEATGYREWGGKMQDDVTDGLLWARKQKLVDAERACIVGMSYGGYAALMGVIKDPDLYRCAISVSGVANLVSLTAKEGFDGSGFAATVGDDWHADEIQKASPYHLAEKIKAPVLLVHGERDTIVNSNDSVEMAEKLEELGKKHELILFENGDHYFSIEEDMIKLVKKTNDFLQKYMPIK